LTTIKFCSGRRCDGVKQEWQLRSESFTRRQKTGATERREKREERREKREERREKREREREREREGGEQVQVA
jgi:hypothetical protein